MKAFTRLVAAVAIAAVGTLALTGLVAMIASPPVTVATGIVFFVGLVNIWSYNFGVWES